MNIDRAPASHGLLWITHGYRLIMRSPLQAVGLAMLAMLCMYLALRVPVVGALLGIVLMPLLLAGYTRACKAMEFHQKVELGHLFQGFEQRTAPLMSLGGLFLSGIILISIVVTLVGGSALGELLDRLQGVEDPDVLFNTLLAAGGSVLVSLLLGLTLLFFLLLSFQFAPMLVFFDQLTPLNAMKTSMAALLRNVLPFTVYSLLLQGIGLAAAYIPYDLGLIIVLPLALTSIYVSYRDIFPSPVAMDATAPASHDTPEG